jgi:thiamine-phosphate pyrophosphorylase
MPTRPILYYITDSGSFAGEPGSRRKLLLDKIGEAARSGIDFIQLREKEIQIPELEALTSTAVQILHDVVPIAGQVSTRLLINSRTDVAIACAADGVHLRSDDVSANDVKEMWRQHDNSLRDPDRSPIISVSCHSVEEVRRAGHDGATYALFGPVFEKRDAPGIASAGLEKLREACAANIPVLALGGITLQNTRECISAGAAGVAGIRLFQENNIEEVVKKVGFEKFGKW